MVVGSRTKRVQSSQIGLIAFLASYRAVLADQLPGLPEDRFRERGKELQWVFERAPGKPPRFGP